MERPRNPRSKEFQQYLDELYTLLTPIPKKIREDGKK